MFTKQATSAAAVLIAACTLSTSAFAQMSINGGVTARFGSFTRDGDVPAEYDKSVTGVDGHYALFLTYTKDLKGGYNAGFNCVTVATTADGATKGFTANALPVGHNWDKFFAGAENFNQSAGGFASYGNSNGDSNGPMCNDEVNGYLQTPYGKLTAGNIMNPMRQLYDGYTVNPVWGNQHGYYVQADLRANALQYSNNWGGFNFIAHLNTATDSNAPGNKTAHDKAYTSVVSYDFGDGTVLGAGAMSSDGDWNAKQVAASEFVRHKSFGLAAKTRLGPVSLGYTYTTGSMTHADEVGIEINHREHLIKAVYDVDAWSFQGYFSASKMDWYTPAAFGGVYTVAAPTGFAGQQFNKLETDRYRVDLWALYDLGGGAKTYVRLDGIQKKYSSPELAGWKANMRVVLLEGGWMFSF